MSVFAAFCQKLYSIETEFIAKSKKKMSLLLQRKMDLMDGLDAVIIGSKKKDTSRKPFNGH